MAAELLGRIGWNLARDKEGHFDYDIKFRVRTTDPADGPTEAFLCPGLPRVGSIWSFGNDRNIWAFCWPDMKVSPQRDTPEPDTLWVVQQHFSTRPLNRCQDTQIENPLNEPPRVSGSFVKFTKQVQYNRNGELLRSSSWELLSGSQVEFDDNRPTVSIGLNLPVLPLGTFSQMMDKVNDRALWGLPARCVKLSNVSWERHLYGTCTFYYTANYEFDINFATFDKVAADVGTRKLLTGGDKENPEDFENILDAKKNPIRTPVPLDGNGNQATSLAAAGSIPVSYYGQANLLLLGIPSVF